MIKYKSRDEIELMRLSAEVVSRTLGLIGEMIRPGVTTLELDRAAEEFIRDQGAKPGFLGQYDYPNTLCTSVNEQVVHGIPNHRPLEEGDILSVDCGAVMNGFWGDHAFTFAIGKVSNEVRALLDATLESLYRGIEAFKPGNRIGDIGFAIQHYAESQGFSVVRELVGHGLGKELHEEPQVPNYGRKGHGKLCKEGMVLAIEPMINMGTYHVNQLNDGWSIVTRDGKPSAHFEHDVAIVDGKPDILSTFKYVEEAISKNDWIS